MKLLALAAVLALVAPTLAPRTVIAQTQPGSSFAPFVISSSSPTTCTNLSAYPLTLNRIWNTGPALTVYPQFYNDTGATCAASQLVYGDGATVTWGLGQVITFDTRLNGLAYKLSGALPAGTNLLISH